MSLSEVLEVHAPLKVKSMSVRKIIPWFNDAIVESIRLHWKLEQSGWKQAGLQQVSGFLQTMMECQQYARPGRKGILP